MVSGGYGDIGMAYCLPEAYFIMFYLTIVYVGFATFLYVIWDYVAEYWGDDIKY